MHPATVVETGGRRLGEVPAVELVTIGQRKGLGGPGGGPARYVVDVDVPARRVTVGLRDDLLVEEQDAVAWRWVDGVVEDAVLAADTAGPVLVQVSAHGRPRPASLVVADRGVVTVRWRDRERRVAPGQSVVARPGPDELARRRRRGRSTGPRPPATPPLERARDGRPALVPASVVQQVGRRGRPVATTTGVGPAVAPRLLGVHARARPRPAGEVSGAGEPATDRPRSSGRRGRRGGWSEDRPPARTQNRRDSR